MCTYATEKIEIASSQFDRSTRVASAPAPMRSVYSVASSNTSNSAMRFQRIE